LPVDKSLPRRHSRLWLPPLGAIVASEPLVFRAGAVGPRGEARLRAWRAGEGHFAVLTDLGRGASLADTQPGMRKMLVGRFGEPLALAEHWTSGHVYLVLPPVPAGAQGTERLRLWPTGPDDLLHDYVAAWWAEHGESVLFP
jgi:hypothetical protein